MSRTDSQDAEGVREFEPGPAYEAAAIMLDNLSVPVAPAEAHGMLCGLLSSQPSGMAKTRWFTELLDAASLQPESLAAKAADVRALDHWFIASIAALDDADLGFMPLLPDDDRPLASRLQALADFCAGFNYGLGIGIAGRGSRPLPGDTAEIVKDFQAIESSDADRESVGADDAGADEEGAYIELVEYVRVGVLLIHEELRPVSRPGGAANAATSAVASSAVASDGPDTAGFIVFPSDPQVH